MLGSVKLLGVIVDSISFLVVEAVVECYFSEKYKNSSVNLSLLDY